MKILSSGVQREEQEKVFTVVRCVDADSITTGMGVRYVGGSPAEAVSADGINAVKMTVTPDPNMVQFAGIASEDIPSNGYGLVQNFGIVNSVLISHVGTSTTIGTFGGINNTLLQPSDLAGAFTSGGPVTFDSTTGGMYNRVQVWQTTPGALSAATYAQGFVRVL